MDHGGRKPIGLALWETTQLVMRAFDDVLAAHGGNRAVWFVFLALDQATHHPTQRELAQAVGITEATLTHHLGTLERRGLVTRHRDARDRRVQRIEFTTDGRTAFGAMLDAAVALDNRLRAVLGPGGAASLLAGLATVAKAVAAPGAGPETVPPPVS
jgi:MarR family transcriptional regulator for hemolysin